MGIDENKEIVRRFVMGNARGDPSVIDELTSLTFVAHALDNGLNPWDKSGGGGEMGRDALKDIPVSRLRSFPDYSEKIEDIFAQGDRVSIRTVWTGTQKGSYRNINPTGKKVTVNKMAVYRLEHGKIAEIWAMNDFLSMYQQLGVLPPTGEIGK